MPRVDFSNRRPDKDSIRLSCDQQTVNKLTLLERSNLKTLAEQYRSIAQSRHDAPKTKTLFRTSCHNSIHNNTDARKTKGPSSSIVKQGPWVVSQQQPKSPKVSHQKIEQQRASSALRRNFIQQNKHQLNSLFERIFPSIQQQKLFEEQTTNHQYPLKVFFSKKYTSSKSMPFLVRQNEQETYHPIYLTLIFVIFSIHPYRSKLIKRYILEKYHQDQTHIQKILSEYKHPPAHKKIYLRKKNRLIRAARPVIPEPESRNNSQKPKEQRFSGSTASQNKQKSSAKQVKFTETEDYKKIVLYCQILNPLLPEVKRTIKYLKQNVFIKDIIKNKQKEPNTSLKYMEILKALEILDERIDLLSGFAKIFTNNGEKDENIKDKQDATTKSNTVSQYSRQSRKSVAGLNAKKITKLLAKNIEYKNVLLENLNTQHTRKIHADDKTITVNDDLQPKAQRYSLEKQLTEDIQNICNAQQTNMNLGSSSNHTIQKAKRISGGTALYIHNGQNPSIEFLELNGDLNFSDSQTDIKQEVFETAQSKSSNLSRLSIKQQHKGLKHKNEVLKKLKQQKKRINVSLDMLDQDLDFLINEMLEKQEQGEETGGGLKRKGTSSSMESGEAVTSHQLTTLKQITDKQKARFCKKCSHRVSRLPENLQQEQQQNQQTLSRQNTNDSHNNHNMQSNNTVIIKSPPRNSLSGGGVDRIKMINRNAKGQKPTRVLNKQNQSNQQDSRQNEQRVFSKAAYSLKKKPSEGGESNNFMAYDPLTLARQKRKKNHRKGEQLIRLTDVDFLPLQVPQVTSESGSNSSRITESQEALVGLDQIGWETQDILSMGNKTSNIAANLEKLGSQTLPADFLVNARKIRKIMALKTQKSRKDDNNQFSDPDNFRELRINIRDSFIKNKQLIKEECERLRVYLKSQGVDNTPQIYNQLIQKEVEKKDRNSQKLMSMQHKTKPLFNEFYAYLSGLRQQHHDKVSAAGSIAGMLDVFVGLFRNCLPNFNRDAEQIPETKPTLLPYTSQPADDPETAKLDRMFEQKLFEFVQKLVLMSPGSQMEQYTPSQNAMMRVYGGNYIHHRNFTPIDR